jgi:hypothetical protein
MKYRKPGRFDEMTEKPDRRIDCPAGRVSARRAWRRREKVGFANVDPHEQGVGDVLVGSAGDRQLDRPLLARRQLILVDGCLPLTRTTSTRTLVAKPSQRSRSIAPSLAGTPGHASRTTRRRDHGRLRAPPRDRMSLHSTLLAFGIRRGGSGSGRPVRRHARSSKVPPGSRPHGSAQIQKKDRMTMLSMATLL